MAEQTPYDVILLDLLMPGIGGYEVLRLMRERGANRATPILVVSVMSNHESRERCRLLGPRQADNSQLENGAAQQDNGC